MIKQIMNKKRDKSGEINFPTDLPRWALFSCEECRQTAGSSVHPSSALKWDHPIRLFHILKQDILQLIASETNTAGFSVNCNQFPYYVLSIFPLELIKAGRSSHIGDEATFWGSTFIERGVLPCTSIGLEEKAVLGSNWQRRRLSTMGSEVTECGFCARAWM